MLSFCHVLAQEKKKALQALERQMVVGRGSGEWANMRWYQSDGETANSEAKTSELKEQKQETEGVNRKQWASGHLLLLLSCALLLWSVWLGDVGSGESLVGSVSGPPPGVLSPSSRDASSSGRETHLRLLPSDDCTPKTELQEFCSKM